MGPRRFFLPPVAFRLSPEIIPFAVDFVVVHRPFAPRAGRVEQQLGQFVAPDLAWPRRRGRRVQHESHGRDRQHGRRPSRGPDDQPVHVGDRAGAQRARQVQGGAQDARAQVRFGGGPPFGHRVKRHVQRVA